MDEIKKELAEMYKMLPIPVEIGAKFTLTFRVGDTEYTFNFITDYHAEGTYIKVDDVCVLAEVAVLRFWKYEGYEKKEINVGMGVVSTFNCTHEYLTVGTTTSTVSSKYKYTDIKQVKKK